MNFILSLVIYPFDIMFSIGENNKKLKKTLKKLLVKEAFKVAYSDNSLYDFNINSTNQGQTIFINGHRQTIVRFGKNPSHDVIAHEIFHAVEILMRYLKMPLCPKNDEAYAYLIGYITEQFYNNINSN